MFQCSDHINSVDKFTDAWFQIVLLTSLFAGEIGDGSGNILIPLPSLVRP